PKIVSFFYVGVHNLDDIHGMNHYMYVNGSPLNFRDDSGNSCSKNYSGQITGAIGSAIGSYYGGMYGGPTGASNGTLAGYSTGVAAFGVAPGHNWTGGGGSCSKRSPNEPLALVALFSGQLLMSQNNPIELFAKFILLKQYYEMQKSRGESSFVDGFVTDRKSYTMALIGLVLTQQLDSFYAAMLFILMTRNVVQPSSLSKGIDTASYQHDTSRGANVLGFSGHDPRAASSRWIKSAWKGIHNPYDAWVAGTGIVLFSLANAIYSATHINRVKYDIKPARTRSIRPCAGGCNFM
ncbi:MAG TPA: hypothetical protein PLP33_31385, partial [Leptospiraceae bacterium]|nr:hypothetical protein [Leptospiraceae bacterium]